MLEAARKPSPIRGLTAGFALSALNLSGAFLTIAALGGLGAWTPWQFIGLFALFETATGLAFILGPNIWHLPVAAGRHLDEQGRVTVPVLVVPALLRPHWGAGAKTLPGLLLLILAILHEGVAPGTAGVAALVLLILVMSLALSLAAARLGVARPDLDVVEIVLHRPGHAPHTLPAFSLSASVIQLVINLGAFPLVKALPPSILFRPALVPSAAFLWAALAAAVAATVPALWLWHGRITTRRVAAPSHGAREAA